ncbi:protein hupE [Hypericibacter terrae]|uniref:Protein hupE n=1 Tax=Hypericibacter terrae TaxID=2602015 RepID=A0A5J6MJT9_9PROT|nr:HupE/UreJ family protein [Hypericibacter terrae]QEX17738.1 protein hupE [Hypericibacter terrae]
MTRAFRLCFAITLAAAALLGAPVAEAHLIGEHGAGFEAGILHPLSGLDHLLVMIAVGIWAAQLGGRAIWAVPCAFVGFMVVGGLLAVSGISMPLVEPGILGSVLLFGLLIATAARVPTVVGMAIVGLFALFHGHAHGTELPEAANPAAYALGFVLATSFLHAVGLGLALMTGRIAPKPALRVIGGGIAAAGVAMVAAL